MTTMEAPIAALANTFVAYPFDKLTPNMASKDNG